MWETKPSEQARQVCQSYEYVSTSKKEVYTYVYAKINSFINPVKPTQKTLFK